MKRKWVSLAVAGLFVVSTAINTAMAWGGSQFAIVMLAVNASMLAIAWCFFAWGWRDALENWGRSTAGWAAAQTWGMQQDTILRDVLRELWEYDEEAVEIHSGRSTNASLEYLKTFQEEDVEYLMPAFTKEDE